MYRPLLDLRRPLGIAALLLLAACQSAPSRPTHVYINNSGGHAKGCDAECRALNIQYREAAEGCRQGNQAACARRSRLGAKMNSR